MRNQYISFGPRNAGGHRRRMQVLVASGAFAVVAFAIAAVLSVPVPTRSAPPPPEQLSIIPSEFAAALPPRTVYRYSVIDSGAYTADELAQAIQRDPIVADHYRAVDVERLRAETVPEDRFAYMSYRRGDKIYWTKNKVRLRQGETILTDGTTQVRSRCGNCISLEPMLPTAPDEPEAVEFETLTSDPIVIASRPSSGGTTPPGLLLPPPFGTTPFDSVNPVPIGPIAQNMGDFGPRGPLDSNLSNPSSVPFLIPPGPGSNPPSDGTPPVLVEPSPFDPPTDVPEAMVLSTEDVSNDQPGNPAPVPEPGTLLLVGGGATGMILRRLRRKK